MKPENDACYQAKIALSNGAFERAVTLATEAIASSLDAIRPYAIEETDDPASGDQKEITIELPADSAFLVRDLLMAYEIRERAYMVQGKLNESISDLSACIRWEPGESSHYSNRAKRRLAIGDIAGAEEDANQAVRLAPDSPEPYEARAEVFRRTNRDTDATADTYRALILAAPTPEAKASAERWFQIEQLKREANTCYDDKNYDRAFDLCTEILRLDESDMSARYTRALALYFVEQTKLAAFEFQACFHQVAPSEHKLRGCLVTTNPNVVDDIIGFFPISTLDPTLLKLQVLQQVQSHSHPPKGPIRAYCFQFTGDVIEELSLGDSASMTFYPMGSVCGPEDTPNIGGGENSP